MNVIELKDIVKTYDMGGAEEVHALRGSVGGDCQE